MKRGLTVRQLAVICSMDYANFSRIENGYQNILVLTLKNIADALEVEIKDLL